MSFYTPHYEVHVDAPGEAHPVFGPSITVLAQITPVQTMEGVNEAAADLQEAYGATSGAVCKLHTCIHDENGQSAGPCTETTLWQN